MIICDDHGINLMPHPGLILYNWMPKLSKSALLTSIICPRTFWHLGEIQIGGSKCTILAKERRTIAIKYLDQPAEASYGLIILTLSLGSIITNLDLSIMYIALSPIMEDLNVPLSVATWAGTSYLMVTACLFTVIGRIGDRQGLKKTFMRGMGLFTFASLLCGISWDIFSLIGARMIQAIGGSMIAMAGPALVASLIPYSSQGRSQGYLTAAAAFGSAIGFGLGCMFIHSLTWRWVFLINILLGISGLLLGKYVLTEPTTRSSDLPIDLRGSFLFSTFLLAVLAGFSLIPIQGRSVLYLQASSLISVVSGTLFLLHYRRNQSTVFDLSLIRNRDFSFALISSFLIYTVFAENSFLFPLFLMLRRQIDPLNAGFIIMGSALFSMVSAPLAGRLADRYGCRPVCIAAILVMIATGLVFSLLSDTSDILLIVVSFCLFRGAIVSFIAPNRKLILSHCPMESKGSGSGILMTSNYSGLVLGVAFFEIIFIEAAISGGLARDGTPIVPRLTPALSLSGYHACFLFGATAAVMALILAYFARDPAAGDPAQQRTVPR